MMTGNNRQPVTRPLIPLLAAGLLLFHFVVLFSSARKNSAVADEPFHLARAVGLVFYHDPTFAVSHPPLANFITGLPLLTIPGLKLPAPIMVRSSRAMDPSDRRAIFANLLLNKLNPDAKTLIDRARIATMILSLGLALLIFRWAQKLYGPRAGLLALALYCLDPNLAAHAGLATNDLAAALFIALALYYFSRQLEQPGALLLGVSTLLLGVAQLAKFSAILLYPIYGLIGLAIFAREQPKPGYFSLKNSAYLKNSWSLPIMFLGSLFVIWIGYGFSIGPDWNFSALLHGEVCSSHALSAQLKCGLIRLLASIPIPPRTFYYGLARTLVLTEQHENALYFLGQASSSGWWFYYPILFLIKTPLPILALLGWRLACWKCNNKKQAIMPEDFVKSRAS